MDLYTMRYVVTVAKHLNFSLAAQECCVGQSALSQQISKLERELGTPLFFRNSRGVTLTEAGKDFVARAEEILQLSEALRAEMSLYAGMHKGTLNLGIITSLRRIDFGNLLSVFCASYPDVSVNIHQGGTYELEQLLLQRKLDLAFLNRPLNGLNQGLQFLKLGEDVYSVAVSPHHPLARRKFVSLQELRDERFIFHQPEQVASELCLSACRKAGFEPNIVCRSASPSTSISMVQGGLGLALLPSEEFRGFAPTDVVEVELKERIVKEIGAAWRRGSNSPLVTTAVDFARDWVTRDRVK